MSPIIEVHDVVKAYGGLRPFRLRELRVTRGEIVTVAGPDAPQASVLVDLLTGTTLPDAGEVRVKGQSTRAIEHHHAWLAFLETFGLAGERVVLLPELTVVQNLAIPLTLSVDPILPSLRPQVEGLAREAGLESELLETRVSETDAAARARIRLGRAIAHDPAILLLEHPTAGLVPNDARAYGADLGALAARRGITVLAVSADARFSRAAGARALEWRAASGELSQGGLLGRLMSR